MESLKSSGSGVPLKSGRKVPFQFANNDMPSAPSLQSTPIAAVRCGVFVCVSLSPLLQLLNDGVSHSRPPCSLLVFLRKNGRGERRGIVG